MDFVTFLPMAQSSWSTPTDITRSVGFCMSGYLEYLVWQERGLGVHSSVVQNKWRMGGRVNLT
jgi:hypothetical protein